LNASVQLEPALIRLTAQKGIISTVPLRRLVHVDSHTVSDTHYRTVFCVSPDHPCLPGHFPGHPLVPGVLVLEHVARALRDWRNQRLARVREVKFLAPLHPREVAELELTSRSGQVRFEMRCDGKVLARGAIEGEA
jgi:3-hydroxyacyl-[acyl-carrier-protein] dehydratase